MEVISFLSAVERNMEFTLLIEQVKYYIALHKIKCTHRLYCLRISFLDIQEYYKISEIRRRLLDIMIAENRYNPTPPSNMRGQKLVKVIMVTGEM